MSPGRGTGKTTLTGSEAALTSKTGFIRVQDQFPFSCRRGDRVIRKAARGIEVKGDQKRATLDYEQLVADVAEMFPRRRVEDRRITDQFHDRGVEVP